MLEAREQRQFDARFAALWRIDPSLIVPTRERFAQSIKDLHPGGVIRYKGEVLTVQSVATYTETNDTYTKDKDWVSTELVLLSLKTGETRYIEWAEDDEVEISFVERKLTNQELNNRLRDDEGEEFDVDEDIDECCEHEWDIIFDGVTYPYDDDWACRYDDQKGRSYNAYIYEFGSDSLGWLTIEGWKDGGDWEYEGYISVTVLQSELEIISLGI